MARGGKRSVKEFSNDFLQDRAAALTYHGVLAIFLALLFLVSLLGLIGKLATQPLITKLGPTRALRGWPAGL
jgi:membrane protein